MRSAPTLDRRGSRRWRSVRPIHVAQVNIALPREPLDSSLLRDFVAALDPVNAGADAARGFVWRLQTGDGDATGVRGFGDDALIVNLSVWESLDALRAFVYTDTAHLAVLRRRREWFHKHAEAFQVLWWVPAGHFPTVPEAEHRLELLRRLGPTPDAFSSTGTSRRPVRRSPTRSTTTAGYASPGRRVMPSAGADRADRRGVRQRRHTEG